jgi:ferredoxin
MELIIEQIVIYSFVALLCVVVVFIYLRKLKRESKKTKDKILKAKEDGLFEPISLHPVINSNCIKTGACIAACPEHDILGIEKAGRRGGQGTIRAGSGKRGVSTDLHKALRYRRSGR